MSEEKSECIYLDCKIKPFESSKDGYCIFHAKQEGKDLREFHLALENHMYEIRTKDLPYNFRNFIFVGDTNFRSLFNLTVSKDIDFGEAEFYGNVNFAGVKFKKNFLCREAEFHGDCFFIGAKFYGETYFERTGFHGKTWFMTAKFHEAVYFMRTRFCRDVRFEGAEFRGRAFISPEFMKEKVFFTRATLENISLTPLNLDRDAWIDFGEARLRNTQIRREDIKDHIIQEQEKDFSKAKEIYLLLKNNFHTIGRYDDESWAFIKEKEMERKSFWHFRKEHKKEDLGKKWEDKGIKDCLYPILFYYECMPKYLQARWLSAPWNNVKELFFDKVGVHPFRYPVTKIKDELKRISNFIILRKRKKMGDVSCKERFRALVWFCVKYPGKYLLSSFLKYLYGWGEKPWYIFFWCIFAIIVCSFLYYFWGTVVTRDGDPVTSYASKLYFSGVTFTALGYGDYAPQGWTRFLALVQSFLGVFFIALFVFSFARKTGGR